MDTPQIVWLRRDLRLVDQPAFSAAAAAGPVIPVYVLDDETPGSRRLGGASRWWLHHSLASLAAELEAAGSRLVLRRGNAVEVLAGLVHETGAGAVHAIRHYEPWWRKAQGALAKRVALHLHDGNYLLPPDGVLTGGGTPFKIFTPFKNALFAAVDGFDILPAPQLRPVPDWPASDRLEAWGLLPARPDWAGGLRQMWSPGTAVALKRLERFRETIGAYRQQRELPARDGSSRLSPHLHFGEVSARMLWQACDGAAGEGAAFFRAELAWRDYARNLLCQFPDYGERPYRREFEQLAWRDPAHDETAAADLAAWQRGLTGYPIVDAGMRQLWQTGWMHNRVRMIAASFLVKHLMIDWRHGDRWFWDTLVDADYASNATNWQWVAGSGVDSNMFVRIMAPLSQSAKFDAAGYIREYVPELARLGDDEIHDPPAGRRGRYPAMRVGHREARERALAAWWALKA